MRKIILVAFLIVGLFYFKIESNVVAVEIVDQNAVVIEIDPTIELEQLDKSKLVMQHSFVTSDNVTIVIDEYLNGYEIIDGENLTNTQIVEVNEFVKQKLLLKKNSKVHNDGVTVLKWGSVNEYVLNNSSFTNALGLNGWSYYADPQTGTIIYCIEPYAIVGGDYNFTTQTAPNSSFKSLSKQKQDYIIAIIENGLKYYSDLGADYIKNSDVLATIQTMIWVETGYNGTSTFDSESLKKYQTHSTEIKKRIKDNEKIPSFTIKTDVSNSQGIAPVYTLDKYDAVTNEMYTILTDTNNVYNSNYKIVDKKYGDYQVTNLDKTNSLCANKNNCIKISTKNFEAKEYEFNHVSTNGGMKNVLNPSYSQSWMLKENNNQDMISSQAATPVYTKFRVKPGPTSKVNVSKIDSKSGAELPGATIQIKDSKGNIIDQWISTDQAHVLTLPKGEYEFCETITPVGYLPLTTCEMFTVDDTGSMIDLEIINEPIKGGFELQKFASEGLDFVNNEANGLKGVEFTLTGQTIYGPVNEKYYTDENGSIIMTDPQLYYGDYQICETKSVIGYVNKNECYDFKIETNNQKVVINQAPIYNDIIKGNVELTKLGLVLDNPSFELCGNDIKPQDCEAWQYVGLKGAEFELYWISADGNANQINDEEQVHELSYTYDTDLDQDGINDAFYIDTLITDELGNTSYENLKYGQYYIRETKAPTGYINGGFEQTFYIAEDGQTINIAGGVDYNNESCSLGVCNEFILGQADIIKQGDVGFFDDQIVSNPRLADAHFLVYEDVGEIGKLDSQDIVLQTLTTDENGYATTMKLRYGNYLLQEIKAPIGYELSDTIYPFEITSANETVLINQKPIINEAIDPNCDDPNYPELENDPNFPACDPKIESEKKVLDYNDDSYVAPNEQLLYTISLKNLGHDYAKNIQVQDDIVSQLGDLIVLDQGTLNQNLLISTQKIPTITAENNLIKDDSIQLKESETLESQNFEQYYFTTNGQSPAKLELKNLDTNNSYEQIINPGEYVYLGYGEKYTITALENEVIGVKDTGVNSNLMEYIKIQDRVDYSLLNLINGDVFVDIPSFHQVDISFLVNASDFNQEECLTFNNSAIITLPSDILYPEAEITTNCELPELKVNKFAVDNSGNNLVEPNELVTYKIVIENISSSNVTNVVVIDDVLKQIDKYFTMDLEQNLIITTYPGELFDSHILPSESFREFESREDDVIINDFLAQLSQNKSTFTLADLNDGSVSLDVPAYSKVEIEFEVMAKESVNSECSNITNRVQVNVKDDIYNATSQTSTDCINGYLKQTGLNSKVLCLGFLFICMITVSFVRANVK